MVRQTETGWNAIVVHDAGESYESSLWWLEKRPSVTRRQICVGGGIKSDVFPSSLAICLREDTGLLPDSKASESNRRTGSRVQLKERKTK